MNSLEVIAVLEELAAENEIYRDLWEQLQEMKTTDRDGYDMVLGDIVSACLEDRDELEYYLNNL